MFGPSFQSIITYWRLYAMIQVEKGNIQKGIESLNKALELIKVSMVKKVV